MTLTIVGFALVTAGIGLDVAAALLAAVVVFLVAIFRSLLSANHAEG